MGVNRVVVIGASGGGVEATSRVVSAFPEGLDAAVFVVVHLSPTTPSVLPQILTRAGKLPAKHARDGERIRPGQIYVAPPDRHLVLHPDTIELTAGPRENHHRPAIDVTFRSAALAFHQRAIGVVLTGSLDDGTAGLYTVKTRGGLTFVQDPKQAAYPSMPSSAIDIVRPHHVLPLDALGPSLVQHVVDAAARSAAPSPEEKDREIEMIRSGAGAIADFPAMAGAAPPLVCPECKGPLSELKEGEVIRFRCHTGHIFSPESLFADQIDDIERALWSALRALDESAALARSMKNRARTLTHAALAQRYEERATEAERGVELIKQILRRRAGNGAD